MNGEGNDVDDNKDDELAFYVLNRITVKESSEMNQKASVKVENR